MTLGEFPGLHKQVLICFHWWGCLSGKVCVEVGLVKRVHTLFGRNAQFVYEPSSGGRSGRSATGGA